MRFRDEARERSWAAASPGLSNSERPYQAAAVHWNTYRNRPAEIISVSQMAMISDDFAEYWNEICWLPVRLIASLVKHAQRQGYCVGSDPRPIAVAQVSMLNQFGCTQLPGRAGHTGGINDDFCIKTLADIFYPTIYHREAGQP